MVNKVLKKRCSISFVSSIRFSAISSSEKMAVKDKKKRGNRKDFYNED
jgi:hypothetical protein